MKELNSYIFESNLEKVTELIKNGADINKKYGIGIRPLISAINSDDPVMVNLIINNGADVNIDSGSPLFTIMDLCIDGMIQNNRKEPYSDHMEILKILLDNGANLQIENEKKERPIDVISAYGTNRTSFERLKSFFRPIISNIDELLEKNKH